MDTTYEEVDFLKKNMFKHILAAKVTTLKKYHTFPALQKRLLKTAKFKSDKGVTFEAKEYFTLKIV